MFFQERESVSAFLVCLFKRNVISLGPTILKALQWMFAALDFGLKHVVGFHNDGPCLGRLYTTAKHGNGVFVASSW